MATFTVDRVEVRYLKRSPTGPVSAQLGPGIWRLAGTSPRRRTALLLCLAGQRIPSCGDVLVDGKPLIGTPAAERDKLIGFLPRFYPHRWTMPVDAIWQLHAAARGRADWDGARYRDALGLPGTLDMHSATVPERRCAEILATIAGDPPVLLFDEPFEALPEDQLRTFCGWLDGWRKDRVILYTGKTPLLTPDATLRLERKAPLVYPPEPSPD